jgi:hypothetical protein
MDIPAMDGDDHKHDGELSQPADGSGDIPPAETRDRTEYYEALGGYFL